MSKSDGSSTGLFFLRTQIENDHRGKGPLLNVGQVSHVTLRMRSFVLRSSSRKGLRENNGDPSRDQQKVRPLVGFVSRQLELLVPYFFCDRAAGVYHCHIAFGMATPKL